MFGKCLGGATVATFQGAVMLIFCGLVHVPYSPALLLTLVAEMALLAFTLTAFGTVIAARMAQVETFQVVMNFIVLPMFFLSGSVFPLDRLPRWLAALTKIDPMTYAIDPMRRAVFDHVDIPPRLAAQALTSSPKGVVDIAAAVGYESEAAFNRAFKRAFGVPPARYRRQSRKAATANPSPRLPA